MKVQFDFIDDDTKVGTILIVSQKMKSTIF